MITNTMSLRKVRLTLTLKDRTTIVVDTQERDYELKYMEVKKVGFPYCILVNPHPSGYGYYDRYECLSYRTDVI